MGWSRLDQVNQDKYDWACDSAGCLPDVPPPSAGYYSAAAGVGVDEVT